jgi:membrane peptidoglycan carboxypeptidase
VATSTPDGRRGRRRRRGGRSRSIALLVLMSTAFAGVIGSLGTVGVVNHYAGDLPSLDSVASSNLAQATRITDRDGNLIEELYVENRTVVPLAKISPLLRQATVATEDRRFYSHQGVDYRRVAIAMAYNLTQRSAQLGASTITEQVIKNVVEPADQRQDRSLDTKIRELLLAEEMERRYSKDQILELYLNSIPYGNQAFGAEAASMTYFGVHATDLDLAQASFLAGLPQRPSGYNPYGTAKQRQAARDRWRIVLDSMVAAGYITQTQADAAITTDLFKKLDEHRPRHIRDPRTAHFLEYVVADLTSRYSQKQVVEGGLVVTTSLSLPLQYQADAQVKKGVAEQQFRGANSGALLAMDPRDGEILAMVGSADYYNEEILGSNNLTSVGRPVGSTFKLYTYGAALESGKVTASSLVDDQNDVIDNHRYSDWDGLKEGMIPLRRAFQESRNLPALWTYKKTGGPAVVSFARRLGITTPIDSPESLPTTLGTNDMSMVEHLSAYSAVDNGGYKVTPHPVLKVTDSRGQVLEQFSRQPSNQRVISPELAYVLTDILRGPARITLGLGDKPVASKSGTTESWTGAYWIGFTPDLALASYVTHINRGDQCNSGFANLATNFAPSYWVCPMNREWGEFVGNGIWKPYLQAYYTNHQWPAAWSAPAGVVKRTVCRQDGNLADTRVAPDQRYEEIFIRDLGEPGPYCGGQPPPPSPTPTSTPTPSAAPTATPTPPRSPAPTASPTAPPSGSPSPASQSQQLR